MATGADAVPSGRESRARRVYRSRRERVVAGVCGGLSAYFDVDPVLVRVLWVVVTIVSFGFGIIAYLVAWIAIPEEPYDYEASASASPPSGEAG